MESKREVKDRLQFFIDRLKDDTIKVITSLLLVSGASLGAPINADATVFGPETVKSVEVAPRAIVLKPATTETAKAFRTGHYSHSSHASHASHFSHRSSR